MTKIKKGWSKHLVLIILLCLFLQMLFAFFDRAPDTDEAAHMQVAKSIIKTGLPYESLQERNLCLTHPPTICYLVAAFFFLFGEGLFAARILSTIWSVIILMVVFRMGSESNHRRSALFATFILAINPAFLYYSHSAYMEITQAFFLLLSFYFLFRVEKQDKLKYYWLSGLFLGLSLITKYSSLVLFVYFIFWLLLLHRSAFFLRKETFAFILPVLQPGSPTVTYWTGRSFCLVCYGGFKPPRRASIPGGGYLTSPT
jgi:4-amino-4-deoxy-L-arabinose transferase-like glycosyltransferase